MSIQTVASNYKTRFGQLETWTWGLFNAIVVGGSTSVTSWLGMAAAHGAGIDVPMLNFKALGVIFLSGAGVKFFNYLSAGLPALTKTTETTFIQKTPDGGTLAQSSKTTEVTPVPESGLTPHANSGTVDDVKTQ